MIDINKNAVFLTPNKWSYEERRLYRSKGNVFFEKNYSKWACILIEKFKDIKILYETKMNRYSNEKNEDCYCIQLDNLNLGVTSKAEIRTFLENKKEEIKRDIAKDSKFPDPFLDKL